MSWNYNDTPEATAPAIDAAPVVAAPAPPETMSADELSNAREQIAQYNDPAIQSLIGQLMTSYSNDPGGLVKIVRELVDQIEKAQQNPSAEYPVDPRIAEIVNKIRQEEREKPSVADFLVGKDTGESKSGSDFNLFSSVEKAASPQGKHAAALGADESPSLDYLDMGDTTQAIAQMGLKGGFKPSPVPDVRDPSRIIGAMLG